MTGPAADTQPYNPLDKRNLGASVAEALLGRRPRELAALEAFVGAGIYAIYYHGPLALYAPLASRNPRNDPQAPIYIGKAVPAGARKGGIDDGTSTRALYKRLSEHAESIRVAGSLDLADFSCRFLVVDDIWIPLGESLLIAKFMPVWNSLVDGFGNHDPGKGRHSGMRPRWDVLHPGRSWAQRCAPRAETADQIGGEVAAYLAQALPPSTPHFYAEQHKSRYRLTDS